MTKNVHAYTQGEFSPSTRFRLTQYLPAFESAGYAFNLHHAKVSSFPPVQTAKRPAWMTSELIHRAKQVLSNKGDFHFLQREMISTLPTFEPFIKGVKLFDVDDAIFLNRNGLAARAIAKSSDAVICGNGFLADYFGKYNDNVYVVPTAVDNNRFIPRQTIPQQKYLGWSGSSSGFIFLYSIQNQINDFLNANNNYKLLISSDREPDFSCIHKDRIEFRKWTVDTEVSDIQDMTIGIMPLDNNPWSLGKCSYKMLLYMACGIPCVVTDLGNNTEVLSKGHAGVGVKNVQDWASTLDALVKQPSVMAAMNKSAPEIIDSHYSIKAVSAQLIDIFAEYYT